jgi:hypothetical protein
MHVQQRKPMGWIALAIDPDVYVSIGFFEANLLSGVPSTQTKKLPGAWLIPEKFFKSLLSQFVHVVSLSCRAGYVVRRSKRSRFLAANEHFATFAHAPVLPNYNSRITVPGLSGPLRIQPCLWIAVRSGLQGAVSRWSNYTRTNREINTRMNGRKNISDPSVSYFQQAIKNPPERVGEK